MLNLTSDFTSGFSQNPALLLILANKQEDTAVTLNIDEYINAAFPKELFQKVKISKINYGPLPYIERLSSLDDQRKENEWLSLVGIDFDSLSEEKRNFLLRTAGIFDFGQEIDIKKVYTTSIY